MCPAARSSQPPSGRAAENAPAEPLHERARWQSAAPPPGDASLWQRLSAACGTSLATLLEGESPAVFLVAAHLSCLKCAPAHVLLAILLCAPEICLSLYPSMLVSCLTHLVPHL